MIKMSIKNLPKGSCASFSVRSIAVLVFLISFFLAPNELVAGERETGEMISRADQLPRGVRRMHKALLRAARSGEMENMREVLQMSELMPLINGQFVHDPVKHWKGVSSDKAGYGFLAVLSEILELPPVKVRTKTGELYIWPYFARKPLDKLSPGELVQLYRLVPAIKAASMLRNNRYSHIQLAIGADGTWHSFDAFIE